MQDVWIFPELQRFLLINPGDAEARRIILKGNNEHFTLTRERGCAVLRLNSAEGTNILMLARIRAMLAAVQELQSEARNGQLQALIITGNQKLFPACADRKEMSQLSGPAAFGLSSQ